MPLTVPISFRHLKLVNTNVFRAIPAFVMGICIGEAMILGRKLHWFGVTVTAITFICSAASLMRTWLPQKFWSVMIVIICGLAVSTVYLGMIVFAETVIISRGSWNSSDVSDLSCEESPLNSTVATACHLVWVDQIKSGISLWVGNVGIIMNTVMIRPPSLDID